MSGNPFRRSMHQLPASTSAHGAASSGADGLDFSSVGDVQPAPAAAAKTKKVRLASPPPSPPQPSSPALDQDLANRLNIIHHAGSPPPSADPDEDSASSTVEATADFYGQDLPGRAQDTENESVGLTDPGIPAQMGTGSTSASIPNPFSRTLATIEPPAARAPPTTEDTTSPPVRPAIGRAGSDKMRASMDVDAFTKMLMTGNAGPAASGALNARNGQQKTGFGITADSSSNTDASSASKQSIFEAHHGAYQESPRSSYEQSVSDDDDRSRLVDEPQKTQKKKPPPPKHKHGKPVQARGPQVVSFNDFENSFDASVSSQPAGPQRTGSDMNKPLPPRPRGSTPGATPREKDLPSAPSQDESLQSKSPDDSSRRRAPPPPPATRRQSAMKTALSSASRSRSTSNATQSSQPEGPSSVEHTTLPPYTLPNETLTPVPSTPTSTTTQSKPPPPPPTRRSQASSHASDNASLPPTRSNSRRSAILSPGVDYTRTPSTTSLNTLSSRKQRPLSMPPGALAQSFNVNAYNAATHGPPPPPPRRASSKSSFDMPRFSSAGFGGGSPADSRRASGEMRRPRRPSGASGHSVGSARREYDVVEEGEGEGDGEEEDGKGVGGIGQRRFTAEPEVMGEKGERDILGEMDSFAREVEALRSRYQGGGGGRE
ncbi:hypothetical protein K490DRAFT_66030 [Saccharata proteae CBS 121410]|uniref:Uncharacterized protein n=1 Tax=Saccharata proteae CBS 121410 TaxID=1314787 RepID=A0A9P4LZQ9_9PEZI|nr:hypothetical protein K490DRAFT_66030 [Saccharata proteae CBS 121410]